jgi:amino acid adenylation domain-containing protein
VAKRTRLTIPYLLPQLLSQSAGRSPERTAVVAGERQLTYGSLNTLSDQLAGVLRAHGVKTRDRVGIYLPMSLASVVSVFAIMKAGASYVPLDPSAPAKRLAYVIRDCGINMLLTNTAKAGGVRTMFPEECPLNSVVLVDCDLKPEHEAMPVSMPQGAVAVQWSEVLSRPARPPAETSSVETDTAYILYTSGSTGAPKGVMISHRNSLTFVNWAAECVGLTEEDRVVCHAPLHFDLSIFSIFSSCLAGAEIVIVPEGTSTFPTQLAKMIESERVSVWYSVPSALAFMVLYGNLAACDLSSLRTIVFAGEVFPVKYLQELMSLVPNARYLNWYGPTETNVCTSYEVALLDSGRTAPIPIGKACANTEVFAINKEGKEVTRPGDSGELYVRGPTLMQGYWGDPEKTAKVLVRNPINPDSPHLVYRTGDIVTLDGDGNYIYIGREDGMIKTRGYRVEAGEIESVLYAHPAVKEAVVLGIPDELFGNRLRAVVSLHEGATLNREELLAHCSQKLPHYMVPDVVEFRKELPKTSTGKVDRAGLARVTPSG